MKYGEPGHERVEIRLDLGECSLELGQAAGSREILVLLF